MILVWFDLDWIGTGWLMIEQWCSYFFEWLVSWSFGLLVSRAKRIGNKHAARIGRGCLLVIAV